MAVFSIIKKSQLEGATRLDAEYYQPEYLEFASQLFKIGEVPLSKVAFITDGQHGYHIVDPDSDIRHITARNVVSWIVNDNDAERLSAKTNAKNKRSILEEDDLLISTAGTVGEVGLVTKAILPANIDQDVAKIHVLDQGRLNPKFLTAFLNSKYGQFQLSRQTTGQIQTHISLDKLKNEIYVPLPDWQDDVVWLVADALQNYEGANSFYSQAEHLLLEELGLKDFEEDESLYWIVNLSDAKTAGRVDAEYFQPKYEKLISKIQKCNAKPLGDLITIKKGFEPGSEKYEEEGARFIRVSNVTKNGLVDGNQKYIGEELYQKLKSDFEPKIGEILLTKDATPGVAYVLKERAEGIIAGGILRLKLKEEIASEYLALCINSVIGQVQVNRDAGGSVIAHWRPDQIKALQIPILSKTTQQKIAELVQKSHEARKKSKELLEEAKRKVEELIESNSKY